MCCSFVRSSALGIEDLSTITAEEFNQKIIDFVQSGGARLYAERRGMMQQIRAIPESAARKMPRAVHFEKDGTVRYSDEITKIAITKQGDTYTIYDYTSGLMTKNMTKSEVNQRLRAYSAKRTDLLTEVKAESESHVKSNEIVVLDTDSQLFKEIKASGKKASAFLKEYIIRVYNGKEIEFSDGTKAIVDKTDAKELSQHAGSAKISQISKLDEMIKKAKKIGADNNVIHDKFDSFNYYRVRVDFGGEIQDILLNVGHGKFDGRYHFYAITNYNEKRATAGKRSLSGSVDNRIKSGSSINSISQNQTDVNSSLENTPTQDPLFLKETERFEQFRRQTEEIDAYARENLAEYAGLSDAGKSMIRKLIRDGRANGVAEDVILSAARVSARSGLDIVFSKEGARGGDGRIEGNTVYINPTASGERIRSKLLLHEVGHAIVRSKKGKRLIAEAFKQISPERSQEIAERYQKLYQKQGVSMEEYVPIINEEIAMHHIEDVLGNANAWEYILSKEQTMGQRFLSFFKGASEAYSADRKLSRTARKLLRTYKKLFDEFAARNQGSNGVEFGRNASNRYALMNTNTLAENVAEIVAMTDEEATKRKSEGQYIKVFDHTPDVILQNVSDAKDVPVIIRFDAAYLATRHEGALEGNYHNYGIEFAEKLMSVMEDPEAIIRLDNDRLNLFGTIHTSKGNSSIVSVELNTIKDINDKYAAYNLVVSMLPAKERYVNNIITKRAKRVEYRKKDLPQVNPQLHKSLSIINGKSFDNSISQTAPDVNTSSKNNSDERMALPENIQDQIENFAKQVDNINATSSENALVVCRTPQVFLDIGLNNLPMTLNFEHARDAIVQNPDHPDRYIGKSALKSLPEKLQNPIAIISSQTGQDTSLVAIVDLQGQNGKSIITPVYLNGESKSNGIRMDVNAIKSAHERKNAISYLLMGAINNETNGKISIFYVDNKKATQLIRGEGLQLPNSFMSMNGFIHSISEKGSPVKEKFKKISQTETKQFRTWFRGSKVVNEDGTPRVVYHGTDAAFHTFDMSKGRANMDIQGAFFSPYEEDAAGYGNNVRAFYLSMQNPADERTAYNALNKFKGQNGAGVKAREYLIKQGYDGVYNGYDEYIAFYPEQIKSATDNIGTFDRNNPDVRYAFPENDSATENFDADAIVARGVPQSASGDMLTAKDPYSYEALISKPALSVVTFPTELPMTESGEVDKNAVVARGRLNAKKQKNPNNTATSTYVRVDDIGQDVLLSKNGMIHGIARSQETALAVMRIGDVLKNSVAVNELNGSVSRNTEMSYVLLGACRDSKNLYVVRSVVSKLQNDVTEIDVYQLSAVKGKKTETPTSALGGTAVTEQSSLISSESPTISIADFIEYVKTIPLANEVFSEDVSKKIDVTRSKGSLSGGIRYALPENNAENSRNFNSNATKFDVKQTIKQGAPLKRKAGVTAAQLEKILADYTRERVYSKKDAAQIVKDFEGVEGLSNKKIEELSGALWQVLNQQPEGRERKYVAHRMAEFVTAKIIADTKDEHYSNASADQISDIVEKIEETIIEAYKSGGRESKFSNIIGKEYWFWKSEYEQRKIRNKLIGNLMSKAQKIKDIEFGAFENATQYKLYKPGVFKSSVMGLANIQFRGNLNVSGTRRIIGNLRSWYQKENPMLGYIDEEHRGYYAEEVAEKMDAIANGARLAPSRAGTGAIVNPHLRKTKRLQKNIFAFSAERVELSRPNHAAGVYIINSARNCISPTRSVVYHHCEALIHAGA